MPDDIATTKSVIDAQKGPVVVVGHSYGGAVITGAAAGNSNVKALVYVAAFAPEAGEPLGDPGKRFAQPPLNSAIVPAAGGFLYIDRVKFHDVSCKDLSAADACVLAATQKPLNGSVFGASVGTATWKTIRSWYINKADLPLKPFTSNVQRCRISPQPSRSILQAPMTTWKHMSH